MSQVELEPGVIAVINEPGQWVALSTVDPDGFPASVPLASLVACDGRTLRCALRETTRTLANIQARPQVGITMINGPWRLIMKGRAVVQEEVPPGRDFFGVPCRAVTINLEEVRPVRAGLETLPLRFWAWNPEHVRVIVAIRRFLLDGANQ